MNTGHPWSWRGMALIAVTYFYFLIFAQFAFLELVREGNAGPNALKVAMMVMGLGGVTGSLVVPLLLGWAGLERMLRIALAGCAATAVLATMDLSPAGLVGVAAGIGIGVGLLTVGVVTSLRRLMPGSGWGWQVGAATGLAYGLCNVPYVFQSAPRVQAWLAAGAALALALSWRGPEVCPIQGPEPRVNAAGKRPAFLWIVMFFGILVWFDSAAFYMIQHAGGMKSGTWGGGALLWRNGWVHGLTAVVAGGCLGLGSKHLVWLLTGSFFVLGMATLMVEAESTRWWGGLLYPAGVSLYSVCLVAYPSFLMGLREERAVAWRAAVLYAVAGWLGSGVGIGMAENLHGIPWFWVVAAGLLLAAGRWSGMRRVAAWCGRLGSLAKTNRREIAVCLAVSGAAWMAMRLGAASDKEPTAADASALGHRVYLAEGCIHCHSQYVRPGSQDELMWGPVHPYRALIEESPPLLGNRRQGPDLLNVGNRRSRAWLRQHFLEPRSVSPGSVMPAYGHLFEDNRGEALVEYLMGLGQETVLERYDAINAWGAASEGGEMGQRAGWGEELFAAYCASCHGAEGDGKSRLRAVFGRPPTDLVTGPYLFLPLSLDASLRRERLARIVKFGLPGTDMPGHEFLPDSEVEALADYVRGLARATAEKGPGDENINR